MRILLLALLPLLSCRPGAMRSAAPAHDLGVVRWEAAIAPAARPHLERGLAAMHSFWSAESVRSFQRAQALDSTALIPILGEAMAHVWGLPGRNDTTAARTALGKAGRTPEARRARARTPREARYLAAVELLVGPGDKGQRLSRFADAMRDVAAEHPVDDEAAILHAGALLMAVEPAQWDSTRRLAAGAIAERIFRRNPRHPGAAHYLIHAYDAPALAGKGVAAARAYAGIAPASSHARHMPSHIFVQQGLWPETEQSNADAYGASVAEAAGLPNAGIGARDYHALSWWQYALLQQGRIPEARALLDTMLAHAAAAPSGYTNYHASLMTVHQGRETGAWAELPARPATNGVMELYVAGMRSIALGDTVTSWRLVARIDSLRQAATAATARRQYQLLGAEVRASMHERRGDVEAARDALLRAAELELEIGPPVGPPVLKPANEHLAEILLQLRDASGAAARFDAALRLMPGRRALVQGRARAAESGGSAR